MSVLRALFSRYFAVGPRRSCLPVNQSGRRQSHHAVHVALKGAPADHNLDSERCVDVRK